MTVDIFRKPNHLHMSGDRGYDAAFGELVRPVQAVSYTGNGHRSFYIVRFGFGLRLEWSPHTAVEVARSLQEVFAASPLLDAPIPDVSGIAAETEGRE
jgi:hypothetical protein